MNLTQIKDEVARRNYGCTWKQAVTFLPLSDIETIYYEVIAACQEQLRRDCAELCKLPSDKQSILKTPLIK